ncbi:MAG TPA: porin [Candidatus Udaeobacter sp.]|nr:porin [Candidatus Udaeobacter sp.]
MIAVMAGVRAGRVGAATVPDSDAVIPATAATPGITPPRLGGYVQAREMAQEHVGVTAVLNRARFSIDGSLPQRFAYRLLVETEASAGRTSPATVSLREAIVRWSPGAFALTAGEFKTPFTREYLIPVPALELADLATAVDSLAPKYDVGMMGEYAIGSFAAISAGVFNGEGANTTANRDSNAMIVSRITARPLPQLSLGASGARDGADSLRWGVDASAQEAGAVVRAEYITRHRRGRSRDNDDFGWYVFESFRAIPRLQLVARQEDFQRPSIGVARRLRVLAWGANVEVAPNRVRLLLEFSRRISGRLQTRADAFIAQAQVQF